MAKKKELIKTNQTNPKKYNKARRKRPQVKSEEIKYKKENRKSRAGVVYSFFTQIFKNPPIGFNYQTRKELDAIDKRQGEGRKYYIKNNKGARLYNKDEPKHKKA